jgi:predicted dehydrogenase
VTIRLGVIGLGAVAQAVHLPLVARRPGLFRLSALCDLAPDLADAMGERFGVPPACRFTRAEDLLAAGGLDAVLIAARGSHAAAVGAAWAAGLPVFSEKPLAYTIAEADDLLAVSSPPPLMVGYMKQYDPAVERAAEIVAGLDDVRSIEATVLHPPGMSQLEIARLVAPAPLPAAVQTGLEAEETRLQRLATGDAGTDLWRAYRGALVSSLAHDLSILRSFGRPPLTVDHADLWRMSSARQRRDPGRDRKSFGQHPPSIQATGTLPGGGRYTLAWHYLPDFPAYRETVRVVHGAGCVELAFPSPYLLNAPTELVVSELDGDAERRTVHRSPTEAFDRQLEAFAALVTDGEPPRTGLEGARADILDCQRIVARYAARAGVRVGGEVGALAAAGVT